MPFSFLEQSASLEVDTLLQEYAHAIFDMMSEADMMNTTNELQVQGSVDDESSDVEEDILETDGNTNAINKKNALDNKSMCATAVTRTLLSFP